MPEELLSVSQAGQDFWVYGEVFNEMKEGYFVDVGAHDGVALSNTLLLELRYGWKGICIEGNPVTFASLAQNRSARCINACIDSREHTVQFVVHGVVGGILSADCDNKNRTDTQTVEVQTRTLEQVLDECQAPRFIDYLTVDVEGAEDRVLAGFAFSKYQFKCLTIERPSSALRAILERNSYVWVKETPWLDCHFVHRSFFDAYHQNMIEFFRKKHRFSPVIASSV